MVSQFLCKIDHVTEKDCGPEMESPKASFACGMTGWFGSICVCVLSSLSLLDNHKCLNWFYQQ
jgi:hypothetical protein